MEDRRGLDRAAAGFAVALREMRIAHRKQRALLIDRQIDRRAFDELFDVEIAAGLMRRDGAERFARDGRIGRYGHIGIGQKNRAAPVGQVFLPGIDAVEQFARRGEPHHAEKRGTRDAHTGQLRRGGKAIAHRPMHQMRRRKPIPQKAEARHDDGEAFVMRDDVQDIDRQQIARLRAFDIDRPGQGMRAADAGPGQVRAGHGFAYLTVERVPGMDFRLVAALHGNHRCDVGVPAVMSLRRALA